MVKEVVRTADLKGRRGRLPTKPKGGGAGQGALNGGVTARGGLAGGGGQQAAFLTQIQRLYSDSVPSQTSLNWTQYHKITGREPSRLDEDTFNVLQSLTHSCDIVRLWAEKWSGQCRLSGLDRDRLFFTNLLDLVALRLALRIEEKAERVTMCNSVVFHKSQFAQILSGPILHQLQELAGKLKQPDAAVAGLLSSLVFLQDVQQIQAGELYVKLREILKEYCAQQRLIDDKIPNHYAQLTDYLIQIRNIAALMRHRLKQYHMFSGYQACITPNSILDL